MENKLRFSILASGSTGNATYIETPHQKILVDAGLSGKKLEESMNLLGKTLADVDKLLVTHEHSDHIKGVGVIARRYNLEVFADQKTWTKIEPKIGQLSIAQKSIFETGKTKTFDDIDVFSFAVSHDAIAPQFYGFYYEGKKFVIATDTGKVDEKLEKTIADADAYLIECNHDEDMLQNGWYPWSLKQRIAGEKGHLSNDSSAKVLTKVIGANTKRIYLGHLSEKNNKKELAKATVAKYLMENEFAVGHDFWLCDTDPSKPTALVEL